MLSVIKNSAGFKQVYQNGIKEVLPYFVVYYVKGYTESTRFGLTVTKKLGNAVIRNRIKRRLRAVVMAAFSNEVSPKNLDIVIVARKYSISADFERMIKSIKSINFIEKLNDQSQDN